MRQGHAMDLALATDGYYFSSEPFLSQQQIEATQLACLLDISHERETILEARSMTDSSTFQLALVGSLQILDQHLQPVTCQQLRQLPLEQLCEQQLNERGWTVSQRPRFCWLQHDQPLGFGYPAINSCATEELQNLRALLQPSAA